MSTTSVQTADIFEDWKKGNFAVVEYDGERAHTVVLTKLSFWSDNADELVEWCRVNGGIIEGLTVSFDTSEQLMMFKLRWS